MSITVLNYHNVMEVQSRTTVECRCVFGGIPGGIREGVSGNYTSYTFETLNRHEHLHSQAAYRSSTVVRRPSPRFQVRSGMPADWFRPLKRRKSRSLNVVS